MAVAEEARASDRLLAIGALQPEYGSAATQTAHSAENPEESIAWNPLSFASARAAVLEAENAVGSALSELVLVADPPRDEPAFLDLAPAQLEKRILYWTAGYAQFVREAAKAMSAKGSGTLVLAIVSSVQQGLCSAMAAAALEAMASSILEQNPGGMLGSCRFIAIKDESDNPETLAKAVIKAMDDPPRNAGKVIKLGGKSFFSKQ